VYERLLAWQVSQGYGKPTDYVFLPEQQNRELVLETYRWQFTWIQQQAGIGRECSKWAEQNAVQSAALFNDI
jgi:hypothetical protein